MSHFRTVGIPRCCILIAFTANLFAADGTTGQSRAQAADGAIFIDQSRAMEGNITLGDSAGFPITISQSGSYRLAGNLTVPDLDTVAIQITADFVTLDLNGFSILGPGTCTAGTVTTCSGTGAGIGVLAGGNQPHPAPRGTRVLNGTVHGMGLFGIRLDGGGSYVEKVTVDSNAGGGMTVSGAVIQSAATQNGSFGIIGDIIRDSTVLQNGGDGIILGVNGGVATGNVSSFNGGFGIAVQFGTATGNTLFLNQGSGISASCPSSVVGNTIVTNGPASVETSRDGCAVANNGSRP